MGVLHRDLKPSNLFLCRGPNGVTVVKILDFGLAKPIVPAEGEVSVTESGRWVGSPRYMAPEQLRATGVADVRVDVWSLGAILYEALTGVAAFEAPNAAETIARILCDDPTPLRALDRSIPESVASIVHLCLRREAALRPPDVHAIADVLRAAGGDGPVVLAGLAPGIAPNESSDVAAGTTVEPTTNPPSFRSRLRGIVTVPLGVRRDRHRGASVKPAMKSIVCCKDMVLTLHTRATVADAEWDAYVRQIREFATGRLSFRNLVFTDGGGPNAVQRRRAAEAIRGIVPRVAVVSSSTMVRGIVTALEWVARVDIKSFVPAQVETAFSHLGVRPDEREIVRQTVFEIQQELGMLESVRRLPLAEGPP